MDRNSPAVLGPVEPTVMQHTPGPWHMADDGTLRKAPTPGRIYVEPIPHASAWRESAWNENDGTNESRANGLMMAASPAMAAALDCIVRRLQMDVDDGSRPDQWSMEDLIRTAKAALPAGWVIGAA